MRRTTALRLTKETLTELAAGDLRAVVGGSAGTCYTCLDCLAIDEPPIPPMTGPIPPPVASFQSPCH